MLLEPPTVVSQNEITLSVREIEPLLQAPPMDIMPWPGATITLKDGRTMYIREATLAEAPAMMGYMKRVMEQDHDFYDVVGRPCPCRDCWLVPQAAKGPLHPSRPYRRRVGRIRQWPADE